MTRISIGTALALSFLAGLLLTSWATQRPGRSPDPNIELGSSQMRSHAAP